MRKLIAVMSFGLLFISFSASAVKRDGVVMPDTLLAGEQMLQLNGLGVRNKFIYELYLAGLYLIEKNTDAKAIVASGDSMAIRLHIISPKITSEKMTKATRKGFDKSTKGNVQSIAEEVEIFLSAFREKIVVGDIFEFVNIAGQGVSIVKNGSELVTIPSPAFKQALFGIWLSDNPVHYRLKEQMLGR